MTPRHVRVFLSSPGDVPDERAAAAAILQAIPDDAAWKGKVTIDVVRWDDPSAPVSMPVTLTPQQAINRGRPKPSDCDLTVVILWSRMGTPLADERKPNGRSYLSGTEWEFEDAAASAKTVLLYRKTADFLVKYNDPELAEKQRQRRLVDDFFTGFTNADGSLNRSYTPFATVGEFEKLFRSHVQQELRHLLEDNAIAAPLADSADPLATARLRATPVAPAWPAEPYPLLRPYTHPEMFAGRDLELTVLESKVTQPILVLCLHAPSGAGKSSLLQAGLLPRLRRAGFPVYLERRPGEVGLARRLVDHIIELPPSEILADDDPATFRRFAAWMARAHELAGKPPVLLLDQVDDFLRNDALRDVALARLGPLLAATAHPVAALGGFPCRWVLCCRRDFQGDVSAWLQDALLQARVAGIDGLRALPTDLKGDDRFHDYGLPSIGQPAPGANVLDAAESAFLDAIARPLSLVDECGHRRYPVRFEDEGKVRLARAFARARHRRPYDALVPELQVVLSHLLARATSSPDGRVIAVPLDEAELDRIIVDALTAHLGRALEGAFPLERNVDAMKQGRARALLALRDLADAHGRRGEGLPESVLIRALGDGGRAVLTRLSAPDTRLVVVQERTADGDDVYALAHDRLAEVITRAVDTIGGLGSFELDQRVVELRRFVWLRADLYVRAHDETALDLSDEQYDLIERHEAVLVVDDARRAWWDVCRRLRTDLDAALSWPWRSPALRVQAVDRVLRRRPDPRFREDAWRLPRDERLGFIEIPGGPFLMGSDLGTNGAWPDESPRHSVSIAAFYIGRWPVTVAQFRAFVEDADRDDGFTPYPECLAGGDSHPVCVVSRHHAEAYCAWLTRKLTGWDGTPPELADRLRSIPPWKVLLPTEAQWEKAARGNDGRIYPWGNNADPDKANYDETGAGKSSPVGCFARGASPRGVEDMSGNVWEWTRSLWGTNSDQVTFRYPYAAADGREDEAAGDDVLRVVRGGAFGGDRRLVRAACRLADTPDFRYNHFGFRVVVSAASSGF